MTDRPRFAIIVMNIILGMLWSSDSVGLYEALRNAALGHDVFCKRKVQVE